MTEYRLVAEPAADADVEAVFGWYENEGPAWGSSSSTSFVRRMGASWMGRSSIAICDPESAGRSSDGFRTQSTSLSKSRRSSCSPSCTRIATLPRGRGGEANTAMQLPGFAGS
jgi:hypothetical protein